jgi:hypothetical protein
MAHYNQGVDMVALQTGVASHREEIQRAHAQGKAASTILQRRIDRADVPDPYIPGQPYVSLILQTRVKSIGCYI